MRYKKRQKAKAITILVDDREKKPWLFLGERWPLVKKRLKVGDYTIEGYEDKVAIEKKSGIDELLSNLTGAYRQRFERYLSKLSAYPVKMIIVEDTFDTRTIYSKIAILKKKSKSRLSAHTIFHWTAKILAYYNVPVVYIDKRASKQLVISIFEQLSKKVSEI